MNPGARCVSEIDCLLSLARCATAHRMCRPQLVRENVIDIVNGRHLLQEVGQCGFNSIDPPWLERYLVSNSYQGSELKLFFYRCRSNFN